jgi:hypothetical protein
VWQDVERQGELHTDDWEDSGDEDFDSASDMFYPATSGNLDEALESANVPLLERSSR